MFQCFLSFISGKTILIILDFTLLSKSQVEGLLHLIAGISFASKIEVKRENGFQTRKGVHETKDCPPLRLALRTITQWLSVSLMVSS